MTQIGHFRHHLHCGCPADGLPVRVDEQVDVLMRHMEAVAAVLRETHQSDKTEAYCGEDVFHYS